jgi:hypothetical protein
MDAFRRVYDVFKVFSGTTVIESPPPASMAGREALRLHISEAPGASSRILVMSKPAGGAAGSYGFHHVDVNDSGFTWANQLLDSGYPTTLPAFDLFPPSGTLYPVRFEASPTRIRVYKTGRTTLRHAGDIPIPAGETFAAWGSQGDTLTVLTQQGTLSLYQHAIDATGASVLSLTSQPTFPGPGSAVIRAANVFSPSSILFENAATAGPGLVWFANGMVYSQTGPTISPMVGNRWHAVDWYHGQAAGSASAKLLVTAEFRTGFGIFNGVFFRVYHFPGSGGSNSWQLLTNLTGGQPHDFFGISHDVLWDAWSFPRGSGYDGTGPVWVVTARETPGEVTVLRFQPDLPSKTYVVTTEWVRPTTVRDVRWLRSTVDRRRKHIELLPDGTLRLVSRRNLFPWLS